MCRAFERLNDARILLHAEQFAGSVSNAGRAVEGMLRAVIWKRDRDMQTGRKSLGTGHDLVALLIHVSDLGLLANSQPDDDLKEQVQHIPRLWLNRVRDEIGGAASIVARLSKPWPWYSTAIDGIPSMKLERSVL